MTTAGDMALWRQAVERATPLPANEMPLARAGIVSWDELAVRRIIAITSWALAVRDGHDPDWGRLAYHLRSAARVRSAVAEVLPADDEGGPESDAGSPHDDVALGPAGVWRWLTRTWEQTPGEVPSWDGLLRGIARGRPDPAVDVCTVPWAYNAVLRQLAAEHGAWDTGAKVVVVGGEYDGARGIVRQTAWRVDEAAQTLAGPDGGVPGYEVALDTGATRIIPTAHLVAAEPR